MCGDEVVNVNLCKHHLSMAQILSLYAFPAFSPKLFSHTFIAKLSRIVDLIICKCSGMGDGFRTQSNFEKNKTVGII